MALTIPAHLRTMLVLHLGATIRWWMGFALGALFARLWIQFGLGRDVDKPELDPEARK